MPSLIDLHVRTVVSGKKIKMSKPYAELKIDAEMMETHRKEEHYFLLISWTCSNTHMYRILLICIAVLLF